MYGIDLSVQFSNLMPSLGLGFLLGIFYDVLRIVRLLCGGKKVFIFVEDILFVTVSSIVSFMLLLAVNFGNIRLYLILAELVGFFVYRCTFGVLVYKTALKITSVIKRILNVILKPAKMIGKKIKKTVLENANIFKKFIKKFKNPLKREIEM